MTCTQREESGLLPTLRRMTKRGKSVERPCGLRSEAKSSMADKRGVFHGSQRLYANIRLKFAALSTIQSRGR